MKNRILTIAIGLTLYHATFPNIINDLSKGIDELSSTNNQIDQIKKDLTDTYSTLNSQVIDKINTELVTVDTKTEQVNRSLQEVNKIPKIATDIVGISGIKTILPNIINGPLKEIKNVMVNLKNSFEPITKKLNPNNTQLYGKFDEAKKHFDNAINKLKSLQAQLKSLLGIS